MDIDYNRILFEIGQGEYWYIGSGSARRVFDLGNGFVIKIAKNSKGIAQNQVEYEISQLDERALVAPVINMSFNAKCLIMVKAIPVQDFAEVMRYFRVRTERQFLAHPDIRYAVNKFDLIRADLLRRTSWGFVDGELLIIDYGFTREVRNRYYSRRI